MCDVSVETILSLIWHDGDMHLHHVDLQNPLRFFVVLWCWCDGLFPLCHSALTEPAGCSCVDTGVSACLCGCEGEQEETPQHPGALDPLSRSQFFYPLSRSYLSQSQRGVEVPPVSHLPGPASLLSSGIPVLT